MDEQRPGGTALHSTELVSGRFTLQVEPVCAVAGQVDGFSSHHIRPKVLGHLFNAQREAAIGGVTAGGLPQGLSHKEQGENHGQRPVSEEAEKRVGHDDKWMWHLEYGQ